MVRLGAGGQDLCQQRLTIQKEGRDARIPDRRRHHCEGGLSKTARLADQPGKCRLVSDWTGHGERHDCDRDVSLSLRPERQDARGPGGCVDGGASAFTAGVCKFREWLHETGRKARSAESGAQ